MSLFGRRIKEFRNDRLLQSSVILSFVFLVLHILGYFDSDGKFEVIVRACAVALYPLFVLIGGRTGLRFWGVVYAYILFWFGGTLYYTPFIMLLFLSNKFSMQRTVLVFLLYAILVSVRSTVSDIAPFRVIFHALKCSVFYFGLKFLLEGNIKKLELTPDEILILEELSKGKNQNELTVFSQNTIFKKLKSARERNGIKTNEELVLKYTSSKSD